MEFDLLKGRALTTSPFYSVELRRGERSIARAPTPSFIDELKQLIRFRRKRERLFGADLFGDPVWDMLLELCLASENAVHISISSLCLASAAPPTTALRWLGIMEKQGMIIREEDPRDKRRIFVRLTRDFEAKLRNFLNERFGLPQPLASLAEKKGFELGRSMLGHIA